MTDFPRVNIPPPPLRAKTPEFNRQKTKEQEKLHEELKTLLAPLDTDKPRQRAANGIMTDGVCTDIPEH